MMQGFSGSVGQQSNLYISAHPQSLGPFSKSLAESIISAQVVGSPKSEYWARSSPAVAPFGQMMQVLSFVDIPPVGARIGGLVGWMIGGVDNTSSSSQVGSNMTMPLHTIRMHWTMISTHVVAYPK